MTLNWRKPLILAGLYLTGSNIPNYLEEIERISKLPQVEIITYQEEKLRKLLLHAYHNVPYYHHILRDVGVIANEEVRLENFHKIPILTKEIIRSNFDELIDHSVKKRHFIHNYTGGSTGEPLHFLQDPDYRDWNFANKIFYCSIAGKNIGQTEMKIWGSGRDLIESNREFKQKITFFLYNRIFKNSFHLTDEVMLKIVMDINSYKPSIIWGYVNSLHIISEFILKNHIFIHSPTAVISASGTLTEDIRDILKLAFGSKVLNVYGSREVGDIACEETENIGLSVFQHSHYVEVVPIGTDDIGDIIVTSLTNFTMPFIRYKIGDLSEGMGYIKSPKTNFIKLKNVVGRSTEVFRTKDNKLVSPEFFIHIIGVVYNSGFIKKFQVRQKDYDQIIIKIILQSQKDEANLKKIENAIQIVMGYDCHVDFEFVDSINPSNNGKFQYTICELKNDR